MSVTKGTIRIWDGTRFAEVDILGYLVGIDIVHHKVHEGNFYTVSDYDSVVQTVAPKYWHIITPNTAKRIHTLISVISNLAGNIGFFEAPTTSANGTALTAYNNDRNSGNTPTVLFYKDPAVTTDGTLLISSRNGTNNNKTLLGGVSRTNSEFILKQNTKYFVKFTPDANNTEVIFNCEFYEV